jgi:LasA protease
MFPRWIILADGKWLSFSLKKIAIMAVVFAVGFPTLGSISAAESSSVAIGISVAVAKDNGLPSPGDTSPEQNSQGSFEYHTQSGDTLQTIAARFQVRPADIQVPRPITEDQLLDPGLHLVIPGPGLSSPSIVRILPDREIVYSQRFDTIEYVSQAGGYLSTYQEYMRSTGYTSAAEILERAARENSINPRLLLALLEYQCSCVTGPLREDVNPDFLIGLDDPSRKGLYRQLGWVINQLSLGYYGWRRGLLADLKFAEGLPSRLAPDLNGGSASLAYLFSRLFDREAWEKAMSLEGGFASLYREMFSDPTDEALNSEPLFPPGLTQPDMILPFQPDVEWGFTSGPHNAWETEAALAALDFAPASDQYGCHRSDAWVVAVADGWVVRSEHGAVVLDLDGDGFEGSGWAILYMHLESRGRAATGSYLQRGDPIGHPSCEGGPADGTHVHIARKYNGEWIAANGPLPFEMSGWVAHAGYRPFEGSLTRGRQIVVANSLSPAQAFIKRSTDDIYMYAKNLTDMWGEE